MHLPDKSINGPYAYFQVGEDITNLNYRDPSGPANLLMLHKFCELVDFQILQNPHRSTALCIDEAPNCRMQATFLLGAYMIMRHDLHPNDALDRLSPILDGVPAAFPYPDSNNTHECLPLADCLSALHRSRGLGWIRFADGGDDGFDPEEYAYFDSPLNADLHEVVPGRLLVSSCPRALPGGAGWADRYDDAGRFVARDFSPAHAADHLAQFDAALCVRVGVPRYGRDALDGTGLGLLDLYCEDTPAGPPAETVARFLGVVDAAAPQAVALQGDGCCGPASALAGACLVRRHGFAAREAAAWLRLVRPGCVSGEHLPFLTAQESAAASPAGGVPAASERRTASAVALEGPAAARGDLCAPAADPSAAAASRPELRQGGSAGRLPLTL